MLEDPWRRLPADGQIRLTTTLPGANLAALHAVARARLGMLRGRMLVPDAELRALADAVARRDAPARDWAARAALLAAGQAELRDIQDGLHQADRGGALAMPAWDPGDGTAGRVELRGAALARWQALAAARLERLLPAVLALEQAHPALAAHFEAERAARIAALSRRLVEHGGISWHRPPAGDDAELPPPLRAATLEARNDQGHRVTLHWRHDAANDMEWLRWQSAGSGRRREDGSVAGRAAVLAALRPLALAA